MNLVDRARLLIEKGGRVHLIGIGGIGMAGVARLLADRGLEVSGCDLQSNRQTQWLESCGIAVKTGHSAAHITDQMDWLIRSTAVPDTHPELQRAHELGIPVSRRGEVLPALLRDRVCIAVSGTHGKTTTTAMIAQVLGCGYCIGGEVDGFSGVAKDDALMVVEADESDGTIVGYRPDYTVITNIEYDHMEHHASEDSFIDCFRQLIKNTKERVYFCADDPIATRICCTEPMCVPFHLSHPPFVLSLPGLHNQYNAAAAAAVCRHWKSDDAIRQALITIRPVRRRFETVFEGEFCVVSDYAHHPTEIRALVRTALELKPRRLLAIFQPHRYSRTLALAADFPAAFVGVDRLWLVPVYAASEAPIPGGTSRDLIARFPVDWSDRLAFCESLDGAWARILMELREGDLLLIVGAGDIESLAERARHVSNSNAGNGGI